MHDSTRAPIIQVNNSAMSGYENVPPSISNHSLYEKWSQLFYHYCDAHRRRYSCQEAKCRSKVHYQVNPETIHG